MGKYVDITQSPYNAPKNGSDITSILTSAIANVGLGQTIYFPAGTYGISSTVVIDRLVSLEGAGSGTVNQATVLQALNDEFDPMIHVLHRDISITDLYLSGEDAGTAIFVDGSDGGYSNILISNIITNHWPGAVTCNKVITSVLERIRAQGGIFSLGNGCTSISLISCYASDQPDSGYNIDNSRYISLVSCASDEAGHYGYRITGGSDAISLVSCGAEQCGYGHTQIDDTSSGVNVLNCYGFQNGASLDGTNHVASAVQTNGTSTYITGFIDEDPLGSTSRIANVHATSDSEDTFVLGGVLDKGVKEQGVRLFTVAVKNVDHGGWGQGFMYYNGDIKITGTIAQNV